MSKFSRCQHLLKPVLYDTFARIELSHVTSNALEFRIRSFLRSIAPQLNVLSQPSFA